MRSIAALLVLSCSLAARAQISFANNDNFQDGLLGGWGGASPLIVPTGGPTGAGDQFLQITSSGGVGAGSHLAANNAAARWLGNYKAAGVTAVKVWFKNFSDVPLEMRIVLFSGSFNRYTSTNSVHVNAFQDWTQLTFGVGPNDLTNVLGSLTYDQVITNVTEIMFRHDDGPPSSGGTPIAAQAGLDSVRPVGTETVVPTAMTLNLGKVSSGTVASLAADDSDALVVCKFFVPNLQSPIIQYAVTGKTTIPNAASLTCRVKVKMVHAGSFSHTLRLFNFQTSGYEEARADAVNLGYQTFDLVGTGAVGRYVNTDGTVQSQIQLRQTGPSTALLPCASWELLNWIVGN